ncbi:hypothetical protein AeMF1_009531 [Aphanomyces euteiches]|nr:hypothetical protein AeMF1_009531 [Aphanomyces euteiches]
MDEHFDHLHIVLTIFREQKLYARKSQYVEFDCQITLDELQARLRDELDINVSTSTINRALDERVFTYKNVHDEPLQVNDETLKAKRQQYVQKLRELLSMGKIPVWMDETNFNLFTARTKGRSKKGKREVLPLGGTQKGKNLHIIGAMSANNFLYCVHKRGAYKSIHANEWLRNMLRAVREHYEGLQDIVVIADNAPCHSRLNEVFEEEEFSEACLLKLSPYSLMMNPIENLWSSLKAKVKSLLRERLAAFMGPPPEGSTREEFRMSYLEHVASQSINGVDVNRLHRLTQRLEYFYGRAENMIDMEVGD